MRLFCAALQHESNRFSPLPTDIASFREGALYIPSTGEGRALIDAVTDGLSLGGVLRSRGHDVAHGIIASAQPGAPVNRRDYEFLRGELLENLQAALPVDAVFLFLHGAMLADGYDDCEGDILERVRALVGPDVPIGVELDLHGNFTERMCANSDILVACKEYPHIDFTDRAFELIRMLEDAASGGVKPTQAIARVPMVGTYFTTRQPMRDFVDEIKAMERAGEALSISLGHGFAWADSPLAGGSVVVVTDNDRDRARGLAEALADRFFSLRREIVVPRRGVDDILDEAQGASEGPIVIADTTDNPGGGAPGDSTFLLRGVFERGMRDVAIAMIWDPMAVQTAMRAGEGAEIPLRIGGKASAWSGAPLDLRVRVTRLRDDGSQLAQGVRVPFGPAAAVMCDGVEIVLNTLRNQTFSTECFTEMGIDPKEKRYLIVKSHQHFHETFSPFAKLILYAAPPGVVNMDYRAETFRSLERPMWPIDRTPFSAYGREWR